jgi:hypothetical protein
MVGMVQNPLGDVARHTQFRHQGSTSSSKVARFPVGLRRRLADMLKRHQIFDREANHSRANPLNGVVQLIGHRRVDEDPIFAISFAAARGKDER